MCRLSLVREYGHLRFVNSIKKRKKLLSQHRAEQVSKQKTELTCATIVFPPDSGRSAAGSGGGRRHGL